MITNVRRCVQPLALGWLLYGVVATAAGQEAKPAAASPAAATTGKVVRGPIKVEVTLQGVIESAGMHEVSIAPKQWAQLVVLEAVPAGTRVTKGQTLVKLDTTKLAESIADQEAGQGLAELALKLAELEAKRTEQSTPVDLQLAERAKQIADEDLERYVATDGPFAKKSAEQQFKMSQMQLEYAEEELKQLEKMYKADDLTEETEEIVLKRARNDVERTKFFVESAQLTLERQKIDGPRSLERQTNAARAANLAAEKARSTLPLLQSKQQLELAKLKYDRNKAGENLANLKHDLELLTISAPADGYVYYGRSVRGKWNSAELTAKLRPGGQIAAREIFMTIVPNTQLFVRASVPEKELSRVQSGLSGVAQAPALGKRSMPVKVREVSNFPVAEGTFEALVDLPSTSDAVAGMTCEVKVTHYFSAAALKASAKAVFTDEADENVHYVYLVNGEGKHTRQTVAVGQTQGDFVEITSGVEEGAKILLQKPTE